MNNADFLREFIIELMVENVQIQAQVVGLAPVLALDMMGVEYDKALREINDARETAKMSPVETSVDFKMEVLGTLERRMEQLDRVRG